MAGELQQTLERLRNKSTLLVDRYNALCRSKADADVRIKEMSEIIERQKSELERLSSEIEYLKIATTLVPDRKEVERSRAVLSGLVREIDKCILELKE